MKTGQTVIAIIAVVTNMAYWWWLITRGIEKYRLRVEQRYGVTIERQFRGGWNITAGPYGGFKNFMIELLLYAYIARGFLLWAIGLGIAVLLQQYVFV